MKRHPLVPTLVLAITLAGCTDTESRPDYEGTWTYAAEDLRGDGFTCSIGDLTLEIENQGGAQDMTGQLFGEFDGTNAEGVMVCTSEAGIDSLTIDAGELVGTFEGTAVTILLDSGNWENIGNLAGDRMSGLVLRRLDIGGQTVRLDGDFTATR
jgi:hypothetical protein